MRPSYIHSGKALAIHQFVLAVQRPATLGGTLHQRQAAPCPVHDAAPQIIDVVEPAFLQEHACLRGPRSTAAVQYDLAAPLQLIGTQRQQVQRQLLAARDHALREFIDRTDIDQAKRLAFFEPFRQRARLNFLIATHVLSCSLDCRIAKYISK